MKSKHLLNYKKRSKNQEPLIDRFLKKIMIGALVLFISVAAITIIWVLYELTDWTPVD